MNRVARLSACACVCALAACRSDAAGPPVPAPYRADIENLCDVVVRSGADQVSASARTLTTATWLGGHLATAEAHDYLVRLTALTGEAKAAALEAEAARVGLAGCALAEEWRAPGAQ